MGLELATYISQLDKSWPLPADLTSQGDDHLRLLKKVLQAQFPGASGDGFSKKIIATEDEINRLLGVTSNIQQQFDNLYEIPSGTIMMFYQQSAPVGWTKVTTVNDAMLRVVTGNGGGSGGNSSPINLAHTHATSGHILAENEMPPHRHYEDPIGYPGVVATSGSGPVIISSLAANYLLSQSTNRRVASTNTGGGASHSHGNTLNTDITPKYIDVIACRRD